MERERPRRLLHPAFLTAALGSIAAMVFASSIGGGFIYDDNPLIAKNPWIHSLRFLPRWFTSDFWDTSEELKRFGYRMIYWRPGVTASYAVDWLVGQGSPVVFHVTNLLWHAAAGMLAFGALRRWMGSVVLPFAAALFFAVHPTKAESVAWIAGRTDVMCAVALLACSLGYARRASGKPGGLALEIAGTVGAYLTKEHAVVIPAFVAMEAWALAGRPAIDRQVLARLARAALPQLGIAAGYIVLRSLLLPIRPPSAAELPFGIYVEQVLETMGRYGMLVFAPHDLSVQQGLLRTERGAPMFDAAYAVLGVVFLAALGGAAYAARRRIPGVTMGILLFAMTVLPTSNVVPTSMMTLISERFLYVPMLGIALAAACALAWAIAGGVPRQVAFVAFAGFCLGTVALGSVAAARSSDFAEEDAFWRRELTLHPESIEALRFEVARSIREHRLSEALALAARGEAVAARWYAPLGFQLDFILQGVEIVLAKTPDHDVETLREVDEFLASAADPSTESITLDVGDVHVAVGLRGEIMARRAATLQPRFIGLRAAVESRLGNDALATRAVETAVLACPGCSDLGRIGALVEARAGRYEEAGRILDGIAAWASESAAADTRAVIARAAAAAAQRVSAAEGPPRLHARATELATLEAWGRAYDVLSPYKNEIVHAPNFALGFAELAWRAGEFDVAREVLGELMPASQVEDTTLGWSRKMGWVDAEGEPLER